MEGELQCVENNEELNKLPVEVFSFQTNKFKCKYSNIQIRMITKMKNKNEEQK
jgi:hypothetical protein